MVEKESKNFLEAIVYFFARLFNSSDVTAYNNALIQAKDAAYSENVEKDLNKMYVEEAKKDALDIEKAFDELNKNADNPPIQNELPEYIKSNKLNNEHIKQELIEIEENRERMINEPDNGLSLD